MENQASSMTTSIAGIRRLICRYSVFTRMVNYLFYPTVISLTV
ncbi:hypothetical protein [Arsenophonus sp.]